MGDLLKEIEQEKKRILETKDKYPDANARRSREFIAKLHDIGFEMTPALDFEAAKTRRRIGGAEQEAEKFFKEMMA